MWFLYFYGISTVISFAITFILSLSLSAKIKRKFPEYKSKETFWENFAYHLILFIPFLNILIVIFMVFSQDKLYEKTLCNIEEEIALEKMKGSENEQN